ncbi:MlaC/ttg2D family ABC transporter substrate-binding protein [Chitinasiproducens palmae]|nr:ABC transporter substrate-binding protein [Chitinasiproducens palmae]
MLFSLMFAGLVAFSTAPQAQTSPGTAATIDASAPDVLIRTMADDILRSVKADPQVKAGNIHRITQLVDEKLLPYADFQRTTRLALGRYWRQATPAQQKEISKQFEMLLIHTYAGATAKVSDQTVDVKPLRAAADATDVVVRTEVTNQGRPYEVDYRLAKTPNGWRIYDVNVLGAWLIEAYRQQFASVIAQQGIDGLLNFLTERNRQLATGAISPASAAAMPAPR